MWQPLPMSKLTLDLQSTLNQLDADSAAKLERLVRDAIALARPARSVNGGEDDKGWPVGYWEKFGGCIAGERWDLPDDPPPDSLPE